MEGKKSQQIYIKFIIDFQIQTFDLIMLISRQRDPPQNLTFSYILQQDLSKDIAHQPYVLLPRKEVNFALAAQSYVFHISCKNKLASPKSPILSEAWNSINRKLAIFSCLRTSTHQQFIYNLQRKELQENSYNLEM